MINYVNWFLLIVLSIHAVVTHKAADAQRDEIKNAVVEVCSISTPMLEEIWQ